MAWDHSLSATISHIKHDLPTLNAHIVRLVSDLMYGWRPTLYFKLVDDKKSTKVIRPTFALAEGVVWDETSK